MGAPVIFVFVLVIGGIVLARHVFFGEWTSYTIQEGAHRPSVGDRSAGWVRGLHGFTTADTLAIDVVVERPSTTEPFSGKLFGATRGVGWPFERLRYGAEELADVFHERSDRFAFRVGSEHVTISAYPYRSARRPYEQRTSVDRVLGDFAYGDTLHLRLVRMDSATVYEVELGRAANEMETGRAANEPEALATDYESEALRVADEPKTMRAVNESEKTVRRRADERTSGLFSGRKHAVTISHAPQPFWRLGWLAGPYAGGHDPAPVRLTLHVRRTR